MTTHVFYFKFPKLQVDLVHKEVEFIGPPWHLVSISAPNKAFIRYEGKWYQKTGANNVNIVAEYRVPKEIRLHMLLLV